MFTEVTKSRKRKSNEYIFNDLNQIELNKKTNVTISNINDLVDNLLAKVNSSSKEKYKNQKTTLKIKRRLPTKKLLSISITILLFLAVIASASSFIDSSNQSIDPVGVNAEDILLSQNNQTQNSTYNDNSTYQNNESFVNNESSEPNGNNTLPTNQTEDSTYNDNSTSQDNESMANNESSASNDNDSIPMDNNTIIFDGLNLTLNCDKIFYHVNETVLIEGTITYNNSLINTSVNIFINSANYHLSETLITLDGRFIYEFVPFESGSYLVQARISYLNESVEEELMFDVLNVPLNKTSLNESDLYIWDDTDSVSKYVNDLITFYANYSSNNTIIANASCLISFNVGAWTEPVVMNYSNGVYFNSRTFNTSGSFEYMVWCSAPGFENKSMIDDFYVTRVVGDTSNVSTVSIVDAKKDECIYALPGTSFYIERTINGTKGTNVVFAPMFSDALTIEKIEVFNDEASTVSSLKISGDVTPRVFTAGKAMSNIEQKIDDLRESLPAHIKQLNRVSYSQLFSLNGPVTIRVWFKAPSWKEIISGNKPSSGHISYLVFSNDASDFEGSTWWNSNWGHRKLITINSSQVAADLTNFPVLINITDTDLRDDAQDDGDDIAFILYSDNTTQLNHEIELFNGATGELFAWVNVTSLSSSVDTKIWMYYNNSGASNQQNITGVWNSNYTMVQHLNETSGTHLDSTNNDNDDTSKSVNIQGSANGQINGADDFDDTNTDYVTFTTSGMLTSVGSVSFWGNLDSSTGTRSYFFSHRTGSDNNRIYIYEESGTLFVGFADVFQNNIGYSITTDEWHYYTLTWSGSNWNIYVDGDFEGGDASATLTSIDTNCHIGSYLASNEWFDGMIDEVRISDKPRVVSWIRTCYNNQNNQSTFISVDSEQNNTETSVDTISPYNVSYSPYSITATGDSTLDNVTLWYQYSIDNSSWSGWMENTTDTSSPWNWSFTFSNGTGYYEFYSIGKKSGSSDETAPGSPDAICYFNASLNTLPEITLITPQPNGTTNVGSLPTCQIWANDNDGDALTVYWYENTSESWVLQNTNSSVSANSTVSYTFAEFSNYSTTYWWKIAVNDSIDNISAWFYFTTEPINTSVDTISPYNQTSSPINLAATGPSNLDEVTVYYRWSNDNITWAESEEIKDTIDSNTTDVDSSSDVGTETNFANAQDTAPDSDYMNIQEGDTGGSEWLDCNAFDWTYTAWVEIGASPYLDAQDQPANFIRETDDNQIEGWFDFPSTSLTGTLSVNISIYCNNDDGSGDDYADVIVDYTGSGSGSDVGNIAQHTSWSYDTIDLGTHTVSEVNNLRVRFQYQQVGFGPGANDDVRIDHVRIGVSNTNYAIDFEYNWSTADYEKENEEICFYVGSHTGSENLNVNYWTGSSWSSLGSISTTGWTNLTATGLTSSAYTIQVNGSTESGDTSQDDWDIDVISLHTWNSWSKWNDATNPDTGSPWSWNFDFPNGNGYYEFQSIGNKTGSPNETAPASADAKCKYNRLPTITNEIPANGSTNIQATPLMNITVNDADEDLMTITWYSNSSGSWQPFGTNNSVGNGTYHQTNSNFSEPFTTYWWYVSVTDGMDTNTSGLYFYFTTEKTAPTVTTNTSTGVEETNATLWGYLSEDSGESCTVRFEWGTTTNYGTNTTNQSKTEGQTFSVEITGLNNGTLYHYRAYANNTIGSDTGNDMTLLTKPQPPTTLTAQTNNSNTIYLTWTTGNGANNTYIEYNTTTNWPRGEGTEIYNNSGTNYEHTSLSEGTTYYYQAWSYTNWTTGGSTLQQWSDNNDSANNKTNNIPTIEAISPTNGSTDISLQPICQIWANDTDGDTLTVYWYENSTETWILQQTNASVTANSTVSWTYTPANNYSITYWWKVAINDTKDNTTAWFYFTTEAISTSVDTISPYLVTTKPLTIDATGPSNLDEVTLYYRWSSDNISWPSNTEWQNVFTETFPNTDNNWLGDDDGDTHQDEYWYVDEDGSDTADIAIDSTNEGTLSAQPDPPALHMEDFDNPSQGVGARADSGLNVWNPSNLGWTDGYINFTYAWYADTNEGIQFWIWNGTLSEIQWYDYSPGDNQEQEWTTYSWQLPQWVLDETEFAFRFEILGTGDFDEVYVDDVTLEIENNSGDIWYEFGSDASYPWQWSFNFPNGSGYYEFYSIGNKTGSPNETAPGSADAICKYNNLPTITNEIPSNGSTNVQVLPQMNITINDVDGDLMTITWYSNSSGSWQVFGTNSSVGNGTYHQINSNFSEPLNTYWWYVNVSDGVDTNTSGLYYYFTTGLTTPTVTTNTSTGVEETNATLHGYLSTNGGEDCTVRFEYGTTTNYGTNTTNQTKTAGDEFTDEITSLTPGQIYHYRAYANNTYGSATGANMMFLTKPQPPTNLVAQTNNSTSIFLTWVAGAGANTTYIERNTTGLTSWDRGQGTMIYNGSGTNFEDTGLTEGVLYYYQAWSYANWTDVTTLQQWSDNNASDSNTTNIGPTIELITPDNGSTNIGLQPICKIWANDTEGNTLNVYWYENTTGDWVLRQTNASINANTTVSWTFSQASNYGITYWWKVAVNDTKDNITAWYYFTTEILNTSVDSINPYIITTSPLTITATNFTPVENVTLYYRWSDDNSSWGHNGETGYDKPFIDNVSSETENQAASFMTWTHSVGTDLDNSILIVGTNVEEGNHNNYYVESADFNGDALSYAIRVAADEGYAAVSEIWYLLNPDPGTHTVRVNFSQSIQRAFGGAGSFYNVKQGAPYHTNTAINTGSPTGLATSVNTEVANSLMIAVATDGQGNLAYSYGTYQEQIYDVAGGSHEGAGSYKLSNGSGSSTLYTNLSGSSNRMSQVVASWTPTSYAWGNGTNWIEWNDANNPDTASPWSWDFNFPNSTGYYEFYSIGKKSGSLDEIAPGSADAICLFNRIPTITNEVPSNQSIEVHVLPQMNITINDADGDLMNLTWYSNSSGSWQAFGTNISVGNGTYHQINSNFSNFSTTYWWYVSVTDGFNTNTSSVFYFTTDVINTSVDPISPYINKVSPLTISATDSSVIDNVTLYYRWSDDNSSWEPWTLLTFDSFEGAVFDWGNYTSGGGDCLEYTDGTYAHNGSNAVDIRDNSGIESSFYHTSGIDVSTSNYECIKVDFWFYADNMDTGHNFSVDYFDGTSWQQVANYNYSTHFQNDQFYHKNVWINESSYNFPTNMKIRFMCDAWTNNEHVYIDEIYVNATTQSAGGNGLNWTIWNNVSNPDENYPWSWNFDFPNMAGYYEFYSIGKKTATADETPPASADARCLYLTLPVIYNEVPINTSTNIQLIPQASVTVFNALGYNMNLTWRSNSSGLWQVFGVNNSVGNGIYYQTNSNFSTPGKTYYWNVTADDGFNIAYSGLFYFTTSNLPNISYPVPNNGSTYRCTPICNVTVSDPDGGTVTVRFYENTTSIWVLQYINSSVDVTTPANVIWNYFNNATQDVTTYWWKVNVSDGKGCYAEEIFHFTTANTSIEITPDRWDQGALPVGSSNETTGFYFNLTNNGSTQLYIQIKASNATNVSTGAQWTLNATQFLDNFTLQYNKSGGGTWTVINLTYDLFISSLDIDSWQTFDLKLITAPQSTTSSPLSMELIFRSIKA